GLVDRHHDVREDRADDEVHAIALEEFLGDLQSDVGLELVVLLDHLGRQAAELAAGVLDAEQKAVEAVLTDHADRPRERRDEPDFHAVGGRRGSRGEHGREHENDQGVRHDGVPPGWLDSWRIIIRSVDAAQVKQLAKDLGADLVGVASAATLNAHPPDPKWPQTPERISPYVKSVIVVAQRIPAGAFRCRSAVPVQYMDMLVLRKMDRVAYQVADTLERAGHPSFILAAQETDWALKRASYGRLSTRHLLLELFVAADRAGKSAMISSRDMFGFWQGLLRVVGSFGDCPRCLAVCPVGFDYHAHLADHQRTIPEKTAEKVAKGRAYLDARRNGSPGDGLNSWNVRWVGPEGYQGLVARQLQAFRDAKKR